MTGVIVNMEEVGRLTGYPNSHRISAFRGRLTKTYGFPNPLPKKPTEKAVYHKEEVVDWAKTNDMAKCLRELQKIANYKKAKNNVEDRQNRRPPYPSTGRISYVDIMTGKYGSSKEIMHKQKRLQRAYERPPAKTRRVVVAKE